MINNIEKIFYKIKESVLRRNPPVFRKDEILDNDFKKFVAIFLSPRVKDSKLIFVCKRLFERVNSFKDIIKMNLDELEEILKPLGLYKVKAKRLKSVAYKIVNEYGGKIPNDLNELLKLEGVGRKIAKIILAELYNKPYVAVDTHVHRISNRIGIVKTKSISETEKILEKILPEKIKLEYNKVMVGFGQTICLPKNPKCRECPIKKYCKNGKGKNN